MFRVTRYSAIVHASVFDAVNGIDGKYVPLHVPRHAPPGASMRAAAVEAAYFVLVNLYPTQQSTFDDSLAASLAGIAESTGSIQRGVFWGKFVVEQILAWRATDGFMAVLPPYNGGSGAGQWRPTPPGLCRGCGRTVRHDDAVGDCQFFAVPAKRAPGAHQSPVCGGFQ
jgi:hypothetical protein